MTKRKRRFFFLTLVVLFFLVAPTVIFYSQGYRIDFNPPPGGKRITQTGGIFLKAGPEQTKIYLDGRLVEKTDFLFGSALIKNLLPRKYRVEVKKTDFQTWEKNLEVKEKMATEAKNIILIRGKINFVALTKKTERFWFSPNGKKIILYEANPSLNSKWGLKLYDLEKNIKSYLIEEKADFFSLEWSPDSKEIYLATAFKEQEKNFVLKLDKIPPVLTEKTQKFNNDIYYLDNFGFVLKGKGQKMNQEPFPVKNETEYRITAFPGYLFLWENKDLYLLNQDSKSFEKFFDGVNDLKISPDNKKITFFSDSEIWVFSLKDVAEQPARKAGEKSFLLRLSEKINDVFWLDNNYLIFNSGNNIKIAETDGRDRIQTWDIGSFPDSKIFFNETDKKLYLLSEGILYSAQIF